MRASCWRAGKSPGQSHLDDIRESHVRCTLTPKGREVWKFFRTVWLWEVEKKWKEVEGVGLGAGQPEKPKIVTKERQGAGQSAGRRGRGSGVHDLRWSLASSSY